MSDEMKSLTTRAVACKHWRWMPGMRREFGVIRSRHDDVNRPHAQRVTQGLEFPVCANGSVCTVHLDFSVAIEGQPDFSDAATLGCLLALVQEAHGALVWLAPETEPDPLDDSEYVLADRLSWLVWVARDGDYIDVIGHGLTPAAALVAALETEWPDWRATKGGKR